MKFGFAPRISIVVAVILCMGVAMTGVLSIHKYQRTSADLITSRFQFIVNDIRQNIEVQMDLGLPLVNLQGISEELESYLYDTQILSIEVFDDTGTVLFSTDPSFEGDLVSEQWVNLWRTYQDKDSWSALEKDAGVVGVPLRNNFGQNVGSLALRYSRAFLDHSIAGQVERLVLLGAAVAGVMTLLSLLGCIVLLKPTSLILRNMTHALDNIPSRKNIDEYVKAVEPNYPEFAVFAETSVEVQDKLDEMTSQIRKFDQESSEREI